MGHGVLEPIAHQAPAGLKQGTPPPCMGPPQAAFWCGQVASGGLRWHSHCRFGGHAQPLGQLHPTGSGPNGMAGWSQNLAGWHSDATMFVCMAAVAGTEGAFPGRPGACLSMAMNALGVGVKHGRSAPHMGERRFAAFAVAGETAGGCASWVNLQATRGKPALGGYLVREFGHGHTASAMFPAGAAGRQTAH